MTATDPSTPDTAAFISVRKQDVQVLRVLLADDFDSANTRHCFLTDDERDVIALIVGSEEPVILSRKGDDA